MPRLALALPPAALFLAACGGGARVEGNPVARAAERTRAVPGFRLTSTGKGAVGAVPVRFSGSGAFNAGSSRGRMTMNVSAHGRTFTFRLIRVGPIAYFRSPQLAGQLPRGEHWFKVDLRRESEELGFDFRQLISSSGTETLDQLREAGTSVERVGSERIRGVATTHYRVTLDPSNLPPTLFAEADPQYEPVDVWIDAQEHVRRVDEALSYRSSEEANQKRRSIRFSAELFDFGIHVRVKPPPAKEVFVL
jgi:hypothetical protein